MSYTAPNSTPYQSNAWANIAAAGVQRVKYLLPPQSPTQFAAYAFDQSFGMAASSFGSSPAPKNTTAANFCSDLTDANAILTALSQPSDNGGGLVSFDGTFCRVPSTWDDFKFVSYTFPGFPGTTGALNTREIFTDNVLARLRYEYFLLDPAGILGTAPTSGGGVVAASAVTDSGGTLVSRVYSLAEIPIIKKQNFVTVYLGAAQPSNRIPSIVKNGGDNVGGAPYLETLPNREFYQKWIANAAANGWLSTVWDGASGIGYTAGTSSSIGQFVFEESHIEPYAGNIIARVTTYLLAK